MGSRATPAKNQIPIFLPPAYSVYFQKTDLQVLSAWRPSDPRVMVCVRSLRWTRTKGPSHTAERSSPAAGDRGRRHTAAQSRMRKPVLKRRFSARCRRGSRPASFCHGRLQAGPAGLSGCRSWVGAPGTHWAEAKDGPARRPPQSSGPGSLAPRSTSRPRGAAPRRRIGAADPGPLGRRSSGRDRGGTGHTRPPPAAHTRVRAWLPTRCVMRSAVAQEEDGGRRGGPGLPARGPDRNAPAG